MIAATNGEAHEYRATRALIARFSRGAIGAPSGNLGVEDAWIRQAPPGATMLAGYATLKNSGDVPISILTVQADAFRAGSVHETVVDNGVSKMRKLERLEIAPGGEVKLAPGGKHLMLMQPRQPVAVGDRIEIVFLLGDGTRVPAMFEVVPATAVATDAHRHH